MSLSERVQVSVSRLIRASPSTIFRVLTDPANHLALDGSGMLRGAQDPPALATVGDTFMMSMYLPDLGDYLMLNRVIAFEDDRRIGWEPTPGNASTAQYAGLPVGASQGYSWAFELRPEGDATIVTETFDCTEACSAIRDDVQDGQVWIPVMHETLARLADLVEAA